MSSIIWVIPILIVFNFVVNNFLSLWDSEMTIFFFQALWKLLKFNFEPIYKIWHFSSLWLLSDGVWHKWDIDTSGNFLCGNIECHLIIRYIKKIFLIYFYWSIVDLQCCINYCCTVKSLSYICIHILLILLFIYLTMLGLCCCMAFYLVLGSRDYPLISVQGFPLQWFLVARSVGSGATGFGSWDTWGP